MGGDHHGHNEIKIPDYKIYKVEDAPVLIKLRERLAAKGLKDPWIRNEVWRFREDYWGKPLKNYFTFIFRGFWVGAALTAVTLGAVKMFSKGDSHGHGHGGDHGSEKHGSDSH